MKSINLSGSLRGNVGKSDANQLRAEGKIPCVLYGNESQVHFWAHAYDLKTVLYTPETYKVQLDVDGAKPGGYVLRYTVNDVIAATAANVAAAGVENVDEVRAALSDTGLPATALELEITESVVVRESLRAAAVLNQLRALGVGIAIDDFGVGYSSFAYLRELPVDRFKLDRSFLSAVPQSPGDSRLAAALIAMAHRLEVGIVAEGVETAEQAAFLAAHQCDEAQGYFLGRPMTEDAFGVLLRQHVRTQREAAVSPPDASLAI